MLGVTQYTQDFDERYPTVVSTFTIGGTYYEVPWFHKIAAYTKSSQVFHCPSDPNTTIRLQSGMPPSDTFATSYAVNVFSVQSIASNPVNQPGVPLSTILKPASTVYLADAGAQTLATNQVSVVGIKRDPDGNVALPKSGCPLMDTPNDANGASTTDFKWCGPNPRHFDMTSIGFMDGHVKAMKVEKWYYTANWKTPWMDPNIGGDG
jgi:hypothetical protein